MTTFDLTDIRDKDPRTNDLMLKWDKLMDNACYLGNEHKYKEKEYGIAWRSAYKIIMGQEYEKLIVTFGNPLERRDSSVQADQMEVIRAVVEKDWRHVQAFHN
jgi:hypothetical protein